MFYKVKFILWNPMYPKYDVNQYKKLLILFCAKSSTLHLQQSQFLGPSISRAQKPHVAYGYGIIQQLRARRTHTR